MEVFVISTCIPEDCAPCVAGVYPTREEADAAFLGFMQDEWRTNGEQDATGKLLPFPSDPHEAHKIMSEIGDRWGEYEISTHTVTAPNIWTCTTDGDDCPLTTTVHATREEAEARPRDELAEDCPPRQLAHLNSLTGDALSEAWSNKFDGACIIEEHTRS